MCFFALCFQIMNFEQISLNSFKMVTNFKSTVSQIKRLIGRKYDDPSMESEFMHLTYTCVKMDNGDIGIKVSTIIFSFIFSFMEVFKLVSNLLSNIVDDYN